MEKSTNTENAVLKKALLSGLLSVAFMLLLTFMAAILCRKSILPQGRGVVYERGILVLSSLFCGILACGKANSGKLLCAAESGAVLLLFVIMLGIADQNSTVINISLLVNFLCIIFGILASCLLTTKRRKRKRKRK